MGGGEQRAVSDCELTETAPRYSVKVAGLRGCASSRDQPSLDIRTTPADSARAKFHRRREVTALDRLVQRSVPDPDNSENAGFP